MCVFSFFLCVFSMKDVVWNCRGAGGKVFFMIICNLRKSYDFEILILLELKINNDKATRVISSFAFDSHHVQDVVGYSGGIWTCWKE